MKKIFCCLLILLVLFIVGCSDKGAQQFVPNEGVPFNPENRFVYERAILIGVDGAGSMFRDADTPNIDRIFLENGAYTYRSLGESPTVSMHSWNSIFTGVPFVYHKVDNSAALQPCTNEKYPTFFKCVRNVCPDGNICNINVSANFSNMIEPDIGLINIITNGDDALIVPKFKDYIRENDFKLMFLYFDDCDVMGHVYGFGSFKHLEQVSLTDLYIGEIYDALGEYGLLENTLFIVTPDHGGTLRGTHGTYLDSEKHNFLGVWGKSVIKGQMYEVRILDIPAIILYALNVPFPENWTACVPVRLFENQEQSASIRSNVPEGPEIDLWQW